MDISGVEEQGDGGDEPHQGSPETSLSPEIVAPGHATNKPMVVYDSDGRGLEDHGVPPPPFLEGRTYVGIGQLHNNGENYLTLLKHCIAMLRPYRLAHTRLRLFRILIAPNNEFSCFQFAFNTNLRIPNYKVVYEYEIGGALVWEESTIDVGGPHAKAIREAVRQIPGLMHGLFVLREGATYWHPRMPVHPRMLRQEERDVVSCGCTIATLAIAVGEVPNKDDRRLARGGLYEMDLKACAPHIWNALNQLQGASSLKEEGDRHKSVDSILENPAITDYNAVLESRLTELGEGYEQAVEACVAAMVWHYLFIKPNVVGDLLRDGFQHSMHMEARQRPYKSPALLGGLSLIGTDALL
ncbi:hypothetical protein SELMODRAFT_423725 [Selaginella moellendorffii]|uniref:Uncharacterized protein n=1 Tax=Selaginella moellendorffii TaxID=88036 RepID=D8SMN8_SELML|nr:hypothetical protein SELMODRAFT_423725 [Selaginella moellendorffii]